MSAPLEGQRALVTGAIGGLGAAVAAQLRSFGVEVIGVDRVEGADLRIDLSSTDEVRPAIARLLAEKPVVVHCAAMTVMSDFDSTTVEDWDRVMAVNARGTFTVLQATLPHLRARRYGRVVTIASIASEFGYRFPAYSASKAAVIALTKSAAVAYAPHGVTVNVVSPGRILTPMAPPGSTQELAERVPVGRGAAPEEIATIICALVRPEMGYITGANVVCDGGMSSVFALHGVGSYSNSVVSDPA